MERLVETILLHIWILFSASVQLFSQSGGIQKESGHEFACTDYSQGKVFIVSAAGKVESATSSL